MEVKQKRRYQGGFWVNSSHCTFMNQGTYNSNHCADNMGVTKTLCPASHRVWSSSPHLKTSDFTK
eukprot:4971840-Amphidinium_carterae.1